MRHLRVRVINACDFMLNLFDIKKHVVPILFGLSIIMIGFLVFSAYNSFFKSDSNSTSTSNGTNNQQSELQKYINTEFGFEFQYPEDWKIMESPYGSPSGKFRLDIRPIREEYYTFVSIYIVTQGYDHNSLFSKAIKSTVIIGGVQGIKYDSKFADIPGVNVFLSYGDDYLALSADRKYEDVLDQLLATFKFFQKDNTPKPLPELKTYRNKEYGFEFQYSEDWKIMENTFGSPASKFNLIVVPVVGRYLPDPVLINIVTLEFANLVNKNLSGEISSNITIAGVNGIKYEYEHESLNNISIILPFGENNLILGTKKSYEDVFTLVLSTFKFSK